MIKKASLFVAACGIVVLSVAAYQAQETAPLSPLPATPQTPASPQTPPRPQTPASPQTPPRPQTPATPPVAPRAKVAPGKVLAPNFALLLDEASFLGVETEEIDRENMSRYGLSAPRGVGVRNVLKDSPAERAGLQTSDVILKFDAETVGSVRKLRRLVNETAPDHVVRLTISRGGAEQELAATIAENRFTMPRVGSMVWPDGGGGDGRVELEKMLPEARSFAMAFGSSRRIGAATSTLTKQLADYFGVAQGGGLLVSNVDANSPAAKAGLRAGDVITGIDGNRIASVGDLLRAMNKTTEGSVSLTVVRDKRQLNLSVTPEQRQGDFDFPPDAMLAPTAPGAPPTMTLPRINSAPRVLRAPRTLPRIIRGNAVTI